jgi:uracil-DNA glycosylase
MPTSRPTRSNARAPESPALSRPAPSRALRPVHEAIVSCTRCPRLRAYCTRIAREKRAAYRTSTYWGLPVPGFGDPRARILIVGLAPAAHGANRTGRVFTGDGAGGSGDFLMAALHANGLANQPVSRGLDDGLRLAGAYIAAAARCAPPDNRPTPLELRRCQGHLEAEWAALPDVRVVVCLGHIAFATCWRVLATRGYPVPAPRPAFGHGSTYRLPAGPVLVAAYHPSRQNTNTGRLTGEMMRAVFRTARQLADA